MARGRRRGAAGTPLATVRMTERLRVWATDAGLSPAPSAALSEVTTCIVDALGRGVVDSVAVDDAIDIAFYDALSTDEEGAYQALGGCWIVRHGLGETEAAEVARAGNDPAERRATLTLAREHRLLAGYDVIPQSFHALAATGMCARWVNELRVDDLWGDRWERAAAPAPIPGAESLDMEQFGLDAPLRGTDDLHACLRLWQRVRAADAPADICDVFSLHCVGPEALLACRDAINPTGGRVSLHARERRHPHGYTPHTRGAPAQIVLSDLRATIGGHTCSLRLVCPHDVETPAAATAVAALSRGATVEPLHPRTNEVYWVVDEPGEAGVVIPARALGPDRCAHRGAQWIPNVTETAHVLRCRDCARGRAGMAWLGLEPPVEEERTRTQALLGAIARIDGRAPTPLAPIRPPRGGDPDDPASWGVAAGDPRVPVAAPGDAETQLARRRRPRERGA